MTTERNPNMGEKYTKEMHETYRKEQDEQAAKEAEEQREKMEKESGRRAWLADGGREADFEKEWPKLRARGEKPGVSAWHLAGGEFPVDGRCYKELPRFALHPIGLHPKCITGWAQGCMHTTYRL